jgi:hypothetical protein
VKAKIYTPAERADYVATHEPHRKIVEAWRLGEIEAEKRARITAIRESEAKRYRSIAL